MSPSRSPAAHAIGLSGAAGAAVIGGKAKPWQTCDQRQPVDRFDVIIIGMGPGGETAAGRLLQAGRRVAVAERELVGGECACIPSKTLLRAPEARAEAARAAGVATPALDWPELRDYRDYVVRHLDDIAQVRGYEQAGATVVAARLADPGRVEAGGELLEADHIVITPGRCRCARTSMAWARYQCGPTGRPPPWPTSPARCC